MYPAGITSWIQIQRRLISLKLTYYKYLFFHHYHYLAARAKFRDGLPQSGQRDFALVDALTLTTDVTGIGGNAIFQAGNDAFSLIVELGGQSTEQFRAQVEHFLFEVVFGLFAFEWDHKKAQDGQRAGGQDAGYIHGRREHRHRDQRPQTHSADLQQSGLGHGSFDAGSQFAGFFVAVIALHNGLDGSSNSVDQFTAASLTRTVAFADHMLQVLRPAALQIAHDLLPFVQVFLHQPVDQALHLIFDLLGDIGQNLLFELGPHMVATHQALDVGQAHGAVKEIQATLFETVQ